MNEPLAEWNMYGTDMPTILNAFTLYPLYAVTRYGEYWENLQVQLNAPTTSLKTFGRHIRNFWPAREWWSNLQRNDTHDTFVLYRDLREIITSHLVSTQFGFNKHLETELRYTTLDRNHIKWVVDELDAFITYFPENATLISLETLPASHFDLKQNPLNVEKQNSLDKVKYIKNMDWVNENIDAIIKFFEPGWNAKLRSCKQGG